MAISQAALDDLARRGASRGVDLAPGLVMVETELRDTVMAQLPFAEDAARHLIDAGGKRFRPMLVLLAGMLGDAAPTDAPLVSGGVVVELVHLASLYHDDVIDAAEVRRGATAAHVKWSNTVAILTGDFLLARASERSAALGVEVTRLMAATIADLAQGQIREVQGSGAAGLHHVPRLAADRAHYVQVITEKTASLISASTRLGALLSGQSPEQVDALTGYGKHLGLAFQLSDDLLDITGDTSESGKLAGTDLREGVRTMPVLFALEQEGPSSPLAAAVAEAVGADDDEPVLRALEMLRAHPSISLARDAARLEARRARHALRAFPRTAATATVLDGLAELADYAVSRVT